MNPFNRLGYIELNLSGIDNLEGLEGLDGFSFKKLKKKLKKTIRKVAKVAAPIVVGVVAGPAAGAAVAKQVYDGVKAKKAAQKEAKAMGVSWTQYKKMADGEAVETNDQLVKVTGNPKAPLIAQEAVRAVQTLQKDPRYTQINQQLAAQGYNYQQRQDMFMQSAPVQDTIKSATAASIYGGIKDAGYSSDEAAVTAGAAVDNMEKQDLIKKVLPFAIPALFLLAG